MTNKQQNVSTVCVSSLFVNIMTFICFLSLASLAGSSDSTIFLSRDDFSRAQNMNFTEAAESAPVPVPLNDPEVQSNSYYEGDMMIQESDENKVRTFVFKQVKHLYFARSGGNVHCQTVAARANSLHHGEQICTGRTCCNCSWHNDSTGTHLHSFCAQKGARWRLRTDETRTGLCCSRWPYWRSAVGYLGWWMLRDWGNLI